MLPLFKKKKKKKVVINLENETYIQSVWYPVTDEDMKENIWRGTDPDMPIKIWLSFLSDGYHST